LKNILVIGDSCNDVFTYCKALRLAPDVPVPVLNVVRSSSNPGMAANVCCNIRALNGSCDLITNQNWEKITKTRFVDEKSNHHFMRVDFQPTIVTSLDLSFIDFSQYSLVAISDYNKGLLTEDSIKFICENHDNVFIDTKKPVSIFANKAKFIKINDFEYQSSLPFLTPFLMSKIIRTTGSEGCVFNEVVYPVDKVEVKDVSGAGDAFFAALVYDYSINQDIDSAIKFANTCASEVVKHRGVTTINKPSDG